MGTGVIVGIVIAVVVVGIIFWAISVYNGLVVLRNRFRNAFSQIDVQLKRRCDLIPNLVETAKGYLKHERETLDEVVSARAAAMGAQQRMAGDPTNPEAMKELGRAEGNLAESLGRLMVVVEAYPDLKANQNVLLVQEELTTTENRISFARQAYNDAVTDYNNRREVFPSSLVAGMCGFREAELFEPENPADREVPKVQF
ncbi:MAG: LemA family protein [Planctomycetia bacterium]|nr:LemA family protein [Planctomycetia bacterium]